MNILLTGSSGFIGRHTLMALLAQGHTVRPIDRKPRADMPSGGIWVDITDAARLEGVFAANPGIESVIHLAANASLQRSIMMPAYDARQNILGTINLLECCRRHGVKRFVFASTSAVYYHGASLPFTEGTMMAPLSPYAASKLAAESYVRLSGLTFTILRYANVYGPGQKAVGENALVARALNHMVLGEPFVVNGDGKQTRDWIHVLDVVAANIRAATGREAKGTYNISTGVGTSVNDVLRILADALTWDGVIVHGPAKTGEIRDVVMDNTAAWNSPMVWEPRVPLEDGLRETAKSWRPA